MPKGIFGNRREDSCCRPRPPPRWRSTSLIAGGHRIGKSCGSQRSPSDCQGRVEMRIYEQRTGGLPYPVSGRRRRPSRPHTSNARWPAPDPTPRRSRSRSRTLDGESPPPARGCLARPQRRRSRASAVVRRGGSRLERAEDGLVLGYALGRCWRAPPRSAVGPERPRGRERSTKIWVPSTSAARRRRLWRSCSETRTTAVAVARSVRTTKRTRARARRSHAIRTDDGDLGGHARARGRVAEPEEAEVIAPTMGSPASTDLF